VSALVDQARSAWKVSFGRACSALVMEPSTYITGAGAGQASLCNRIKEIAANAVAYRQQITSVTLARS